MTLILPYHRVPDTAVEADDWMWASGVTRPVGTYAREWDYNSSLHFTRLVRMDFDRVREETKSGREARFGLVACWAASGSGLRGSSGAIELEPTRTEYQLSLQVDGSCTGGVLSLLTRVILLGDSPPGRPFAAHLAGSILWEDRVDVRLEGDEPMFPISVVDFGETNFPVGAEWHLEVGSAGDSAALGSLRLYLNSQFDFLPHAFESYADNGEPNHLQGPEAVAMRAIKVDVARIMIMASLNLDPNVSWPDASLGATLLQLVSRVFPEESLDAIRQRHAAFPADFETDLRSRLRATLNLALGG